MNTWIALFRGINVGGHHILPMKELKALLLDLGCENVQTYIQSGNVVFSSASDDANALSEAMSDRVAKDFGFRPDVLLLTPDQLQQAIDDNPFPKAIDDPKTLHLSFLTEVAHAADLDTMTALKSDTESFKLSDAVFYLHAPDGIGRSKLAAKTEALLGVSATARNWRTVIKLQAMLAGQ